MKEVITDVSYQKELVTRKTVTEILTVPAKWGMYSVSGDKRLQNSAVKLVEELKAAKDYGQKYQAVVAYFKRWEKLGRTHTKTQNFCEAGDAAVREAVIGFVEDRCSPAFDLSTGLIESAWHDFRG